MTRQIKFRAWDTTKKRMIKFSDDGIYALNFLGGVFSYSTGNSPFKHYSHDDTILMQFTGLLDKNGKEIYESDLIEFDTTTERRKEVVVFDRGWFGIKMANTTYPIGNLQNIELVGNIYESK